MVRYTPAEGASGLPRLGMSGAILTLPFWGLFRGSVGSSPMQATKPSIDQIPPYGGGMIDRCSGRASISIDQHPAPSEKASISIDHCREKRFP